MKRKLRVGIAVVLAAVLVVGVVMIVRQQRDYKKGKSDYDEALTLAMQPAENKKPQEEPESGGFVTPEEAKGEEETPVRERDPYLVTLEEMNWQSLQEINPEVVGWISIPDTLMNYPVLQTDNNWFYLDQTWKKEYSSVGSIFMECQNRADLSQFNTLIYGHNMRDGSMFCNLRSYLEQEYWEQHPYVYLAVEKDVRRYDIYAAYEVGVWEITYGLEFEKDEDKQEFIDFGLSKSKIDTGIVPTVEDEVLTLSTCTGNGNAATGNRWVIQAVWNKEAG